MREYDNVIPRSDFTTVPVRRKTKNGTYTWEIKERKNNWETKKATYTWEHCIGRGWYCDVWSATRITDERKEDVAIKSIPQRPESKGPSWRGRQVAEDEIKINNEIRGDARNDPRKRYLLSFEESFIYEWGPHKFWCLVFKLAKGRNLHFENKRLRYPEEEDVAKLMHKLLLGVDYLHNVRQCVHFDLDTENIMFYEGALDPEKTSDPIICDFGNVIFLKPDQEIPLSATERRQAPLYQAPELRDLSLTGLVSRKSDMFSLGMICIELLFGFHPFEDPYDRDNTREAVSKCNVDFSRFEKWDKISQEGQDFVKKLTCIDPKVRWSVTQALGHAWIKSIGSLDPPLKDKGADGSGTSGKVISSTSNKGEKKAKKTKQSAKANTRKGMKGKEKVKKETEDTTEDPKEGAEDKKAKKAKKKPVSKLTDAFKSLLRSK